MQLVATRLRELSITDTLQVALEHESLSCHMRCILFIQSTSDLSKRFTRSDSTTNLYMLSFSEHKSGRDWRDEKLH